MTVIINGTSGITTPTDTFTGSTTPANGVYLPAANTLGFTTNSTRAMTLDASGNLGIGTSSPAQKFHVYGAGSTYTYVQSANAGSGAGTYFANSTRSWLIGAGPQSGGSEFQFYDVTAATERMRIDSSGNVGIGTSSPSQKLTVKTADGGGIAYQNAAGTEWRWAVNADNSFACVNSGVAERMRIDSSGNLCVGLTSALGKICSDVGSGGYAFNASFSGANGAAIGYVSRYSGVTGVAAYHAYFTFNGGYVGSITSDSTATYYNSPSDYRLKENVQPMQNALDVVAKLNPVTYKWKSTGGNGQGFIAHELQAVVPDCVTGEKDAVDDEGKPVYQGIDTSFLVATLTKAIQEQQAMIESLTTRLTAAEEQILNIGVK